MASFQRGVWAPAAALLCCAAAALAQPAPVAAPLVSVGRGDPDHALALAYLGVSRPGASLGEPLARPRLYEDSWQTLLLPTAPAGGTLDPAAPALRAVITAYRTEAGIEVDLRFSRPTTPKLTTEGGWALVVIDGYQPDGAADVAIGDGALAIRSTSPKPGLARLGLWTGTNRKPTLTAAEGGRLVTIVLPAGSRSLAPSDGDSVGGGAITIDPGQILRTETGGASWYGNAFHGRKTASGERYNMHAMTAAHKTIKLGTWVRVTNTANGKQVVVRINDRGPFVRGRIIDCSRAAASALGFIGAGVAHVRVEVLAGKP